MQRLRQLARHGRKFYKTSLLWLKPLSKAPHPLLVHARTAIWRQRAQRVTVILKSVMENRPAPIPFSKDITRLIAVPDMPKISQGSVSKPLDAKLEPRGAKTNRWATPPIPPTDAIPLASDQMRKRT
jgi:hypothetical protein